MLRRPFNQTKNQSETNDNVLTRSIRSLDAFPKVESPYLNKTSCGGIASIITYALMGGLMLAEVFKWAMPPVSMQFTVDKTVAKKMILSFDISVATECNSTSS